MSTTTSLEPGSGRTRTAVRVLGALLLLVVGADHYYEYSADQYSVLPTIGTLFLLNFISATAIGLLLLAPIERLLRRFGRAAVVVASGSGAAIAGTSLAALLVSEQTKLFGFMESNYRPAIIVAIATETAATLVLGVLLVLTLRGGSAAIRRGGSRRLETRCADPALVRGAPSQSLRSELNPMRRSRRAAKLRPIRSAGAAPKARVQRRVR